MAQEEVMQMADDPIQDAITRLEKQYEEDKQSALEKQRQEYEKHFQQLKSYMSPSTPYPPFVPYDPFLRIGKAFGVPSMGLSKNYVDRMR